MPTILKLTSKTYIFPQTEIFIRGLKCLLLCNFTKPSRLVIIEYTVHVAKLKEIKKDILTGEVKFWL